jgi:peptidoglycan hydrolase CwlO-like protein
MSANSIEMSANDGENDDNDDDFLPPGFIPGAIPLVVVDLHSPSNDEAMKSPLAGSHRKEFLRRSISALDSDNDGFVDLLGLKSMQKENIANNADSFWFQTRSDHQSIVTASNNDKSFTGSNQTHDAMDLSYFHTSPDSGINAKLDELAADLEAEVVAGNLFLQAINTPLLSKKTLMTNGRKSIDFLQSNKSTQNVSNMKREIAQLNDELSDARREAMIQRERATQLDIELQQLAISSAAEQHTMHEQCRQYEKEVEYMASKMKEALKQVEESDAENVKLSCERDELRDLLLHANNQIATGELEKEKESARFKVMEAKLTSDLHSALQMFTDSNQECRTLTIRIDETLKELASLKMELFDTNNQLEQSVAYGNETKEKMRTSESLADELKMEILRLNELLQSKDDVVSTYINAANQGNVNKIQLSKELLEAESRINEVLLERDDNQTLLCQLRDEKSKLDDRYLEIKTNLSDEIKHNAELMSSKDELQEKLRQAEDLALLVAADNDSIQQRLIALQQECEVLYQDKATHCASMEQLNNEKDQKIRSLQRLVGAMQCLFDDCPPSDDNGNVRSSNVALVLLKKNTISIYIMLTPKKMKPF